MTDAPRSMETWATLHRAHARTLLELTRRMEAEVDVSVLEHGSLYELNSAPQRRLRMVDLAERLGISPSAATRLADRLEERGWLTRESPRDNRRTVYAVVTREGRRAYLRNNRHFTRAVEESVAARLTPEQMRELCGLLSLLAV